MRRHLFSMLYAAAALVCLSFVFDARQIPLDFLHATGALAWGYLAWLRWNTND